MNILHRFNLLVKGRINAVLDALEDPERSLLQLVQDMEEELDAAKRAVARAMANEDRLRAQIAFHAQDAGEWQRSAERALGKGDEAGAREALRRVEKAERQREKLGQQLEKQSAETEEVRQSVVRMQERVEQAKSRLQLVQAQMRQMEARRAIGDVLATAGTLNLHGEFDRISARVEEEAATERNYQRLDDELLRRGPPPPLRGGRGGGGRRGAAGEAPGLRRLHWRAAVRRLWRRLLRLLGQSRIVLPRRTLRPEDLRPGDRLEIGETVFRVRGALHLQSGPWAFRLEETEGKEPRPIRLLAVPERPGPWTLIRDGRWVEVPGECVRWWPVVPPQPFGLRCPPPGWDATRHGHPFLTARRIG